MQSTRSKEPVLEHELSSGSQPVKEGLVFAADIQGERLDIFLARVSGVSRAQIQRYIAEGAALVKGVPEKPGYRLRVGETVLLLEKEAKPLNITSEEIALEIVYQDQDFAIINKAQGMVVHPAPGNLNGTLVNALLFALEDLSGIGGVMRPGIVHRLDKMTSGLLAVAKNDYAHASFAAQFKAQTVYRAYLALVEGNVKEDSGVVNAPIGRHPVLRKRMAVVKSGRCALTHWRVLERLGQFTLLEASLKTGRTHQIRVHAANMHHPVAGDTVYSSSKPKLGLKGQALHAYRLSLTHPRSGEEMSFFAPPPHYFIEALKQAGWSGIPVWEAEHIRF